MAWLSLRGIVITRRSYNGTRRRVQLFWHHAPLIAWRRYARRFAPGGGGTERHDEPLQSETELVKSSHATANMLRVTRCYKRPRAA
jgi:hypothetical protein